MSILSWKAHPNLANKIEQVTVKRGKMQSRWQQDDDNDKAYIHWDENQIDGSKVALRISPLSKQIIQLISSCQLRLSSVNGLILMGIPSVLFLALPPCIPSSPKGTETILKRTILFNLQIYSGDVL